MKRRHLDNYSLRLLVCISLCALFSVLQVSSSRGLINMVLQLGHILNIHLKTLHRTVKKHLAACITRIFLRTDGTISTYFVLMYAYPYNSKLDKNK